MKNVKKGFTLLETILVLATALIIIAGVFRIYYPSNENAKINKAVSDLAVLKTGIENLVMADRDVDLSNGIVLMSKIAPDTMISNSKLLSPWKGDVVVSKHPGTKGDFDISYKGLPKSNCVKFIAQASKVFNTISSSAGKKLSEKASVSDVSDFCTGTDDSSEFVLSTYSEGGTLIATGPTEPDEGFDATPGGGSSSSGTPPSETNQPTIPDPENPGTGTTPPTTGDGEDEDPVVTPPTGGSEGTNPPTSEIPGGSGGSTTPGGGTSGGGTTPPATGGETGGGGGGTTTTPGGGTVVDTGSTGGGSSGGSGGSNNDAKESIFSNADGSGLVVSFNKSYGSFIIKDSGSDYQLSFSLDNKSVQNTTFMNYLYGYIFDNTLDTSKYNEVQTANVSVDDYSDLYNSKLTIGGLNTNKIDFGDVMNIMSDYYTSNNYLPTVSVYAGYDNVNSYLCGEYKFCSLGNYNGRYNFDLSDMSTYSYTAMTNSASFNRASINKGENNLADGINTQISNSGSNNIAIGDGNSLNNAGSNNLVLGTMNKITNGGSNNTIKGSNNSFTNSADFNTINGNNSQITGSGSYNTISNGANANIVNSKNNNTVSGGNAQMNGAGSNNNINGDNSSMINVKDNNAVIGKNSKLNGVANSNTINGNNSSINGSNGAGASSNMISGTNSSINGTGGNNSIIGDNSTINNGNGVKLSGTGKTVN